jgi:2-oxoglutarate ferredoxin oxidoreductase subunit beta
MKEHDDPLQELSFVPAFEEIAVQYEPGTTTEVKLHDGSRLLLRKLEEPYDATDRAKALARLSETHAKAEVLTGLLFVDPAAPSYVDLLSLDDRPLATLPDSVVRPAKAALDEAMEELK